MSTNEKENENNKAETTNSHENIENVENANQAEATIDVELVNQKLVEAEKALDEEKKKYLYLYAEFENYKKRAIKDRSDLLKYGIENISKEMLHVIDNLERAVFHAEKICVENPAASIEIISGVKLTINQFLNAFKKFGVTPFDSLEQNFDPNFHDAIGILPVKDKATNLVIEEHQKGYKIHDRLLRPAKVVVSTEYKEEKK